MSLFNSPLKLSIRRELVILTLSFNFYIFAQQTIIGCRPPSSTTIAFGQNDSLIYYTPNPYNTESYIIQWNFITHEKDSFAFQLPEIEGKYKYRLTSFTSNGRHFILSYVDYVFVLELDGKKISVYSQKHLKDRAIEECAVINKTLKLVSTSTKRDASGKQIDVYSLDFENNTKVHFNGSSLFLSHLSPSHYFSFRQNYALWVDPLSYIVYQLYDSLELPNEYHLNVFFSQPNKYIHRQIVRRSTLEGKLSVIMSELDSLEFDFIEEVHPLKDSSYIVIYSQKGTGMAVGKPWKRKIAYFNGSSLLKTEQLDPKVIDVLNLVFFVFNDDIFCLTNYKGIIQVRALDDVIMKI